MRGLVIQPHRLSLPGTIGERAAELGIELVPHVASVDGPMPPVSEFDFVLGTGAPWSVYDEEVAPWIDQELDVVRDSVARDVPFLGVCFGAQAFAEAMGGRVFRAERPELGWGVVETDDPELVPAGPWFMWHEDTFKLPPEARLVAWTDSSPQAYTLGPHLLVQFHPEVNPDLLGAWCASGDDDFTRFGVDRSAVETETAHRAEEASERAGRLFDRFLAGV